MPRGNLDDLSMFMVVVRYQSFTRAAGHLGMSQSALSHAIRGLENRLELQLLNRTTRSISLTEAGDRLVRVLGPRLEEIETELSALDDLRDSPSGTVRITAVDHVIENLVWPKLDPILKKYPDIKVEFFCEYRLVDIVAERFDIGIRRGDQIARDMIALRMTPDQPMLIVGSPDYLKRNSIPVQPEQLIHHNCINLRLSTQGGNYAWELEKDGTLVQARVDGQLTFNRAHQILDAVLSGYGLSYLPQDLVQPHIDSGALKVVMRDWGAVFPGYHLYYPSRRKGSGAVSVVLDALKYY